MQESKTSKEAFIEFSHIIRHSFISMSDEGKWCGPAWIRIFILNEQEKGQNINKIVIIFSQDLTRGGEFSSAPLLLTQAKRK